MLWKTFRILLAVSFSLLYLVGLRPQVSATTKQQNQIEILSTAWSPNGNMIAGGGYIYANGLSQPFLRIWDATTRSVLLDLHTQSSMTHDDFIISLAWSPDSTRLASSGTVINIWDVTNPSVPSNRLLAAFSEGLTSPVRQIAWSPDGKTLASLCVSCAYSLRTWRVEPNNYQTADKSMGGILAIAWSPDLNNKALALGGHDRLYLIDVSATGLLSYPFTNEIATPMDQGIVSIAWSKDAQKIAVAAQVYPAEVIPTTRPTFPVYIYNTTPPYSLIRTISETFYVTSLAWNNTGTRLAMWAEDQTIRVRDTANGNLLASYAAFPDSGTFEVAWSPRVGEGNILAYGGKTGDLKLFDTATTPSANRIGNWIWMDTNGNGLQDTNEQGWTSGITVRLLNNSFGIVDTTTTSSRGYYSFADIAPGDYYIEIIPPADTYTIAPVDRGTDDTRDSDFDWRDNFGTPDPTDRVLRSMRFTASAGMQRDDLDAGFMPNSDLDVRVWRDTNGDGVQDSGEQGMANVSLFLRRANFTRYRDPLTTDSDGFATFTNLPAGDYYVQINVPSGYSLAPFNIGPDDNIDNDFAMAFDYETGSGNVPRTLRFTLAPGLIREDIDAGLKQP